MLAMNFRGPFQIRADRNRPEPEIKPPYDAIVRVTRSLVGGSDQPAALIYHATLVLMTLFYNCIWWYAIKTDELLEEHTDKKLIRHLTKEYAIAPALHLAAFVICLWSVPFSIIPVLLLYVYFALPRLSEQKVKKGEKSIKNREGLEHIYL